jgi:hypothetical protein
MSTASGDEVTPRMGRFVAGSRVKLREVAARMGVRHLGKLGACAARNEFLPRGYLLGPPTIIRPIDRSVAHLGYFCQ